MVIKSKMDLRLAAEMDNGGDEASDHERGSWSLR